MRSIPIPTNIDGSNLDVEVILTKSISNYRDKNLKKRLASAGPVLQTASSDFERAAKTTRLHTIGPLDMRGAAVSGDEMENVYTAKMAALNQPGRPYYDMIRAAAPRGICPFCGVRTVSTLDHFLPKSDYPLYSITPVNLVPSCGDCNKLKMTSFPKTADDQLFHPYFDEFQGRTWLFAEVIEDNGITVVFSADPPAGMGRVLAARIVNNFETLQLASLYSSHAAEELVSNAQQWKNLHAKAGAPALTAHLTDAASSRNAVFRNSWQTAFYEALASDDWFHEKGITLL